MPNLASALKQEITRLARKEIKSQTSVLRRSSAQYRRDIARLKREIASLEKKLSLLESRGVSGNRAVPSGEEATAESTATEGVRFSARSVRAQRKRLNLSAAEYGKLVGVSGQTIYMWELGKSRPRKGQLAALVAVRGMSKREALVLMDSKSSTKKKATKKAARPRKATKKTAKKKRRGTKG